MPTIVDSVFATNSGTGLAFDLLSNVKDETTKESKKQLLNNLTIDVASSFAQGLVTTPLKAVTGSKTVKSLKDTMANGMEVYRLVSDHIDPEQVQELVVDIVSGTTTTFTGYVMKELNIAVKKILEFPEFSYITKSATELFVNGIKDDVGNLMAAVSIYNGTKGADYGNETKKKFGNLINKVVEGTKRISSIVDNSVSKGLNIANENINKYVVYYLSMGPDFLQSKIEMFLQPVFSSIHNFCVNTTDNFCAFKDRVISGVIKGIAQAMRATFYFFIRLFTSKNKQLIDNIKNKSFSAAQNTVNESLDNISEQIGTILPGVDIYEAERIVKKAQRVADMTKMILSMSGG